MLKERHAGWMDVTVAIENGMTRWPGDIPVKIGKTSDMDHGATANVTSLSMSAHTGTHLDAPKHFFKNGGDITTITFDRLIGAAKVFHISNPREITLQEIEKLSIQMGDRILFRTCNSDVPWSMKNFRRDYVFLSTKAAEFLVNKVVACIGIDYLSIAGAENGAAVHRLLLGADVCIIEGLDLSRVQPGEYDMICLPLKIHGADGAPARVIIKNKIDGHGKQEKPHSE